MTGPSIYPFDHFGTTEAQELWLAEVEVDFSGFDAVQMAAAFGAAFRGEAGTFRIRIGGTSREADGLEALTLPRNASSSWVEDLVSLPRIVLRNRVLFKLTAQSAVQDSLTELNAASLTIWTEPTKAPLVFKMPGVDIWLGDERGDGAPEYHIAQNRDWLLIGAEEAYKQSLRRRFITNPGEYKNKPDYGAGLSGAVKLPSTRSNRDGMAAKLREQAMRDTRTKRVVSVVVEPFATNGIEYSVVVEMRGGDGTPVTVSDRIPGDT